MWRVDIAFGERLFLYLGERLLELLAFLFLVSAHRPG